MEVLALSVVEANPEKPSVLNKAFRLQNELQDAGLDLVAKRGVLTKIVMGDSTNTNFFFPRNIPFSKATLQTQGYYFLNSSVAVFHLCLRLVSSMFPQFLLAQQARFSSSTFKTKVPAKN